MSGLEGGRYELLWRLGNGGFGQVWRARDHVMGREVAIKLMHERHLGDRDMLRRFERELDLAGRLAGTNVVHAYDRGWGERDGRAVMFLVMQLLDGMSLEERIERAPGHRLSVKKVVAWGAEICQGLKAAHNAGLIHRDLKPSNIQITHEGHAMILDFGIACFQEDQTGVTQITERGAVVGTPAYMSPEQCRGEGVGVASDLYSLGCVLYAMLTGRPPFLGPDMMRRHQSETPLAPQGRRADIPDQLDDLVMDLLEKRVDKRPGIAAVLKRLEGVDERRVRQEFRTGAPPGHEKPTGPGKQAPAPAPPPPPVQQPAEPDGWRRHSWPESAGAGLISGLGMFGLLFGGGGAGAVTSVVCSAVAATVLFLVGVAAGYGTGEAMGEGGVSCLSCLGWFGLLIGCVWLVAARGDFPWYYDFLIGLGLSVGIVVLLAFVYTGGEEMGLSDAGGVLVLLSAGLLGVIGAAAFAVHYDLVWWTALLSGLGLSAAGAGVTSAFLWYRPA
ncbi:hypothetical protein B1R27_04145 [Streptomyces sp. GKU 895]|nr:hypothetical protein B1R27_04145 [Streptomyces sp. GKU 895]